MKNATSQIKASNSSYNSCRILRREAKRISVWIRLRVHSSLFSSGSNLMTRGFSPGPSVDIGTRSLQTWSFSLYYCKHRHMRPAVLRKATSQLSWLSRLWINSKQVGSTPGSQLGSRVDTKLVTRIQGIIITRVQRLEALKVQTSRENRCRASHNSKSARRHR